MARSFGELMGLEAEAERLVRMGESRAEVSRRLGVHPQTLAGWALRGGWRRKDLEMERSQEIARETIRAIRSGNAQVDQRNAARAPVVDEDGVAWAPERMRAHNRGEGGRGGGG